MVVPLDSLGVAFPGQYGSWRLQHLQQDYNDIAKLKLPLPLSGHIQVTLGRASRNLETMRTQILNARMGSEDPLLTGSSMPSAGASSLSGAPACSAGESASTHSSSNADARRAEIASAQIGHQEMVPSSFHGEEPPPPDRPLKRRRPLSDVDGPNTASLGSKKRRLLRHLITSRLSQPFSLPATHILNRESVANGDKRFAKLAAIMAARRLTSAVQPHAHQHHPSQSSLLRRAAMINRFRLRVRHHASERGDMDVAQLAANATLLQQSHGIGLAAGTRFPVMAGTPPSGPQASPLRIPSHFKPQNHPPHPLSKAAAKSQASPPGSPPPGLLAAQPSSPALRFPLSPRTRPTRPLEQRLPRTIGDLDEDEDDDVLSFPDSDLDGKYEASDDPDDVYADFGVIFGGSSDNESSDDEADHYEEYMDDLDGIPWSAR